MDKYTALSLFKEADPTNNSNLQSNALLQKLTFLEEIRAVQHRIYFNLYLLHVSEFVALTTIKTCSLLNYGLGIV